MLQYIVDGGIMMYPLVFLSILSLAVIIDRVRAFRAAEGDTTALRENVLRLLQQGKAQEAMVECRRIKGPVAAVLLVGLDKYDKLVKLSRKKAEIELNVTKTMSDYAPHVMDALDKRVYLLTLTANVAPLLGMCGTVIGMIRAFDVMADMGGLQASMVAGGIAEALITTAAGLLIAIPSAFFSNTFSKKIDKFVLDIEESATELIDFITLEHAEDAA